MLGNSRFGPCSKKLKRELLDRWKAENCDPRETVCYVGIGYAERHRFEGRGDKAGLRSRKAAAGWAYEAPLCEPPYLAPYEIVQWAEREDLKPPRLYDLGFSHNNCGGACVKAGHAQWRLLLKTFPERYAMWEREEQSMRDFLGRQDIAILTERKGGEKKTPLTLVEFRERVGAGTCDLTDMGNACNCFAGEDATL